jgi:hypothetical protein
MRKVLIGLGGAALIGLALLLSAGEIFHVQGPEEVHLVTADVALVRGAASTGAEVVARLPAGTRVRVLERTEEEQEIGGERSSWLRVAEVGGEELGWVFGALTVPLDPSRPEVAYGALIGKFLALDRTHSVPFETAVALEKALVEAERAYGPGPELALMRVDAVDLAGKWVGVWSRNPAHGPWFREHEGMVRETADGQRVSAEWLWKLADRYRDTPAADSIAFRAAWARWYHCEDDATCWLRFGLEPAAAYLERFPAGERVEESLRRLHGRSEFAADLACWNGDTDRARVEPELVARTRVLVEPLASPWRDSVLAELAEIEARCGHDGAGADTGSAGDTAGAGEAARTAFAVEPSSGTPELVFEPIAAPVRVYLFTPYAPRAVQLIAAPDPGATPVRPELLLGIGHSDTLCRHEIRPGVEWTDAEPGYERYLPTWTVAPFDSVSGNTTENALAFEPADCPSPLLPRVGFDDEAIAWAGEVIGGRLGDSLGVELDAHLLKGAAWEMPDGSIQTWVQLAFVPAGSDLWRARRHQRMAAIRHGADREPSLIELTGPADGFTGVPFALLDLDGDDVPEVFAWDWVPTEESRLYEYHGVAIYGSKDGESYRVWHRIAGWRVDMH